MNQLLRFFEFPEICFSEFVQIWTWEASHIQVTKSQTQLTWSLLYAPVLPHVEDIFTLLNDQDQVYFGGKKCCIDIALTIHREEFIFTKYLCLEDTRILDKHVLLVHDKKFSLQMFEIISN